MDTRGNLSRVSFSKATWDMIPLAMNCDNNKWKCCLPEKVTRDSMSRVFIGGWSHRHPLPSICQNSRSQKESKNNTIYTNSLDTMSHSYHLRIGHINAGNCIPNKSQPCKAVNGLSKDSLPAILTIFCTCQAQMAKQVYIFLAALWNPDITSLVKALFLQLLLLLLQQH